MDGMDISRLPRRTGTAKVGDVDIYYEDIGERSRPAALLTMGLAAQHVYWPDGVVNGLLGRGFRVIRYDNRDIGLSSKIENRDIDPLPRAYLKSVTGRRIRAAYTLYDMADDAAGLLDALEVPAAHLVGASMGGMISQIFAALHRERTLSLTSIMSSTLHRSLPAPRLDVMARLALIGRRGRAGREQFIAQTVAVYRAIHGKGYPFPEEDVARRARAAYDRCYDPWGAWRQSLAILATGSFEPILSRVRAPALVVHGKLDPLVSYRGGQATARAIRGARLEILPRMGHFMHEPDQEQLVKWIAATAEQVDAIID